MQRPLADEIRPKTLDEVVGQKHLLAPGSVLRRLIERGTDANMVFYGPSGTGKTTIANIIAQRTNKTLYRLNATTASLQDVKDICADVGTLMAPGGVLLYLDEIQYFNKKQQQSLLEFMENGSLTLIASTTENPYFYVYSALLSRSTIFEFKAVSPEETESAVLRALKVEQQRSTLPLSWEEGLPLQIATAAGGDVRKAINAVELLCQAAAPTSDGTLMLTSKDALQVSQRSAMRYDRDGDAHYDILSALQKSIRGSDPDAAVHYLGRLLEAGDLLSPCRRLLVIAAEDIGLAYPQAIVVTKACVDLKKGKTGEIPRHLQNVHADTSGQEREQGYLYPHDFPHRWVKQQYLPDALQGVHYYEWGDNKTEQAARAYWEKIKGSDF